MSIENRLAAKKRAQNAARARKRNKIFKVIGICLIPVIIAIIGYLVFLGVIKNKADTSSYINADGTIDAKPAKSYVTLCDYKNISVNREDYLPTESEVQEAIDSVLDEYVETVKDAGAVYGSDAMVNLTFTVVADGEELKDLAYADKEYQLGDAIFSEEFDKKISELAVGDEFSFEITFAEDFDVLLAGKKALFEGSVVSAKIPPELTDEFVNEKLSEAMDGSDYPLTADGYRDFTADTLYTSNLETYVDTYITDNTKVNSYPYMYVKSQYYLMDANYKYYVDYYNSMYNSVVYSSPVQMLGLDSKSVYKDKLLSDARSTAAYYLAYQAIFEDAGLEAVTEQDVKDYVAEFVTDTTYDTAVENYGFNYWAQQTLKEKAFQHVMSLVDETGDLTQMWKPDTATGSDATINN